MKFFNPATLAAFVLGTVAVSVSAKAPGYCPQPTKSSICKALAGAGLVNLNLLNCNELDISPVIDILKRDEHLVRMFKAERSLQGTDGKEAGTSAAALKRSDSPRKALEKCDEPKKTHGGSCKPTAEELCSQMAALGLANLNLLGCNSATIDPKLKIGEELLPSALDILAGVASFL